MCFGGDTYSVRYIVICYLFNGVFLAKKLNNIQLESLATTQRQIIYTKFIGFQTT